MRRTNKGQPAGGDQVSVEKAFDWFWDPIEGPDPGDERRDEFNAQRAVLAAGFLLNFYSQGGNTQVDGRIAQGLGILLHDLAADELRHKRE